MGFVARYHGECAHGDEIKPGELVNYNADDELVHTNCEAAAGPVWTSQNVCPDCQLEHAGECL